MRFFLSIFLLTFLVTISAQDTLLITQVDTKPQLRAEDIPVADGAPDQERLFLIGIYSTVSYPSYARKYSVQAMVEITYLVDVNGVVSIDKTRTLSPEEVKNNDVPKKEMITIIAYATRPVNGGSSIPVSSSWQTKNQKRLTKAYKVLEEAAAASILTLPDFVPGSHNGKSVIVRDSRFFVFQLK